MALFSRKSPPSRFAPVKPARVEAGGAGGAGGAAGAGDRPWREERIFAIGSELLDRARRNKSGLLSAKFWSDKLMDWSMKDPAFKVQLFRFVDCFPVLTTPEAIHEHLTDYLTQPGVTLPPGMALGLKAGGIAKGMMASTISSQIKGMAAKFIAGADAAGALPGLKDLWNDNIAFSVDLLGEACVSEAEADVYQKKYLDLIENLPGAVASWKANAVLERDHLGAVPRVNVSVKISSLSARCDPIDTEGSIRELMKRLVPILEAAKARGVFVNFDMEQFALKDLTIELFMRCCDTIDFHAGLAMQAYLKSGDDDARRIVEWAKKSGRVVTVRLVKGAYWDYETINAEQMGWPCPVWPVKRETDACFERMAEAFLSATPRRTGEGGVKLALGSHNVRSIAAVLDGLERRELPREAIELQMLHGMADQLKDAAAEMGLRVREYVPVGDMIPGMAYLVRRLLENTSNESWLKAGFMDHAEPAALLASPHPAAGGGPALRAGSSVFTLTALADKHELTPPVEGVGDNHPFINEPFRDFSRQAVREAFAAALARASVPRIANDRTPQDAAAAVARAHAFFPAWRDTDARDRARVLTRAAGMMRERRDELAGVMIKEAGKTWREADADVCEAIDFCEFYARLAVPLFEPKRLGRFAGELNEQWHHPRGVAVVISPWNFPLAICCGMTVAALVTGNTVILKPAEQTPGIAALLADILWQSLDEVEAQGGPALRAGSSYRDALHFLPAPGETTGAALVRDPRVSLIAFTGSRDVGLDILNAAAPPSPFAHGAAAASAPSAFGRGRGEGSAAASSPSSLSSSASLTHVKHVVCEMGGKNAVIIDESADLDEAVLGVRRSAFGFQGQKCSACSRAIVVESVHDHFVERLVESTRALVVGDPAKPGTDVGPVIDEDAKKKILHYIERGRAQSTLALGMPAPANGTFVGPHIFTGVKPDHDIARDEIFGPVLAVIKVKDFDEALRVANDSPYKLTGGVFSRRPGNLERARREFRVGNLYLNRGITGALVARQPFGGFGMSGTGSKAGGTEYLLHFVEPRACTENTMRRGFAPEV